MGRRAARPGRGGPGRAVRVGSPAFGGRHPLLPFRTTTAAPVPAFEDDLRLVREAQSRTLSQVQQETRIPVDVLKRFEDGLLVGDPTYNEVYLRAFLRSYARAVGLPQGEVVEAYGRSLNGAYRGELHPDYDPATAPPVAPLPPLSDLETPGLLESAPGSAAPAVPAVPPPAPRIEVPRPTVPAPVEALRTDLPPIVPPPIVGARVARPGVRGARRPYDKNWASILGLFAAVVAALALAVYFLVFRTADEPDEPLAATDGAAAQIDSAGVGAAAGGPQFQLPISVTVSAAGDGLQSFRVSVDGDRGPYWINAGTSQTYTADSSLVLWGEGTGAFFTDATVEVQGLRWTPPDGRPVTIDRARGQRLLDSLTAAGPPAAAPAP